VTVLYFIVLGAVYLAVCAYIRTVTWGAWDWNGR